MARNVRRLGATVVLILLLPGCFGGADPGIANGSASIAESGAIAAETIPAPTGLAVGNFWTWTSDWFGTYNYVISGSKGTDWTMSTDNPDLAFLNKRGDVTNLGPVAKADLAGSYGTVRVQFFQFPLTPNATWTTPWGDETVKVRVLSVAEGVASLEARRADGSLYRDYTYLNATRYFGQLNHYDSNGVMQGTFTVTASGERFSGKIVDWELAPILEAAGSLGSAAPNPASFDVPLAATDVYAEIVIACTSGSVFVGLAPAPFAPSIAGQDERGVRNDPGQCPTTFAFFDSAGVPKKPAAPTGATTETWGYTVKIAPQSVGTYRLTILLRTLVETTVARPTAA